MTYLLQISIGPVQGFIAASRKTRDLAMGSKLLTEIGKVVTGYLDGKAKFIFPASAKVDAANIILVTCEGDPAGLANGAKAAALAYLKAQVQEAKKEAEDLVREGAPLDEQAERLLEWFAAWVPLGDNYQAARKEVGRMMAARKALRDFPAAPREDFVGPKSPLDPSFAGVLKLDKGWKVDIKDKGFQFQVKEREHLDAVGLVKRFGDLRTSEEKQHKKAKLHFPSTRTIAVPWVIRESEVYRELEANLDDSDLKQLDLGDLLAGDFSDLLSQYSSDKEIEKKWKARAEAVQQDYREKLRAVCEEKKISYANLSRPYYAVIHADGDGMGALLDGLAKDGIDAHTEFSRRLEAFAKSIRGLAAVKGAALIYAGGDDVVALAPLDTAVEFAAEIQKSFEELVAKHYSENKPTLTLGLGAVHVQENLQEAIEFGRFLEKQGKNFVDGDKKKNALTIGARARGGGDVWVTAQWSDGAVEEFKQAIADLNPKAKKLPRGYPYEMRALYLEMEGMKDQKLLDDTSLNGLVEKEVIRIRNRKQPAVKKEGVEGLPKTLKQLKTYADRMLVAHFFTREGEMK